MKTLEEQLKEQGKQIEDLTKQLALRDELIAALLKKLYGAKSEQIDTSQLLLDLLEEDVKKHQASGVEDPAPEAGKPKQKKPQARQSRFKDSLAELPRTERTIIPVEVRQAPELFRRIGEEINEKLHIDPATFTVERIIRPTYARIGDPDEQLITAPLEPSLLPKSHLTPSLAAHLLTEKFCYHQPYYRQEWKLKISHGIELDRSLMCKWQKHLATLCLPLHQLIATQLRSSPYLRVDETPISYLEPGTGKAQKGYLWTYHSSDHGVLYDWHIGRSNTCLDNILIDPEGRDSFEGFLQSDGFKGYQTFLKRCEERHLKITPISCLAHIRRKFFDARSDHPKVSAWILYQISKIYHLESRLARRRARPTLRKRARKLLLTRTFQHLENLFSHLRKNRKNILPKSNLGKALNYAIDQWPKLEPCLEEEQIAWDNNRVENDIRPTKLGAKNWLFIGLAETGWQSAVIYTLIEQIRSKAKDPAAYLTWLFEKLINEPPAEELPDLLPASWLVRQESKLQSQAA